MGPTAKATSASVSRVQAALLDYFHAPGKYQLGCRQPDVLFNALREVLQVATGRVHALEGRRPEELKEAAAFFVGAALLYPGADHYSLLGVTRNVDESELKERYRMLMRLVHPDFAGATRANWPSDSAMRVNRAYEVLSSPVLRREYEEQSVSGTAQHRGVPKQTAWRSLAVGKRPRSALRGRMAKRGAWAFVVLVSLAALAMLLPHTSPVTIVQKPGPGPSVKMKTSVQVTPSRSAQVSEREADQPLNRVESVVISSPETMPLPVYPGAALATRTTVRHDGSEAGETKQPKSTRVVAPAEAASAADPPEKYVLGLVRAAPTFSAPAIQSLPLLPKMSEVDPSDGGATLAVAVRQRAIPSLSEVQPLLTRLLQELESGNPDRVLGLLEPEARRSAGARGFSRRYLNIVKGSAGVTLSHVEFRSEAHQDVLVVLGDMRLSAGESTIGSLGEKLLLRAEFASRGGGVTLTRLSGGTE